ncbi:MAG: methyltransferase domain-containing protein [Methylococcales bacterium]
MSQTWNANQYIEHASFVAEHGSPVLKLLDPKPGERILDLGCGDGALTADIGKLGAIVHGVDSSRSMIDKAKKRGLSAEVMSGDKLSFSNEFDAVFTNAALHWIKNSGEVIRGVSNSLKAGGRFVGEFGGKGNVETLVKAIENVFANNPDFGAFYNPWYFPDAKGYRAELQDNGFVVNYIELIPRPTPLQSGAREWLKIFSKGITKNLSPSQLEQFLGEVERLVSPKLFIDNEWVTDYVRLRFHADKI